MTTAEAKKEDWLEKRLDHIRGLKPAAEHQQLMLLLAEKESLTQAEKRQLTAAIALERAEEKRQSRRDEFAKITREDREQADRARTHRLIQRGGLSDLAGLQDMDDGEFLGALLGLSKVPADDPRRGEWKRAGDALLAERAQSKKKDGRKKEGGPQ